MAAYAALVSVMQIIHQIQNHPSPPISLDEQQVESLTEIVTFLQEFLEGYKSPVADSDEADPLEMRIADAAYAAEDVIESYIVDRIQSQRNKMGFFNWFRSLMKPSYGKKINVQKVIEDMDFIKKEVMEIVAEKEVVQDQFQRQVSSASASLTKLNSTMVGFDDVRLEIMDKLTDGRLNRHVIPIVGMGGIGKTTLARNVYAQPLIKEHFDICVWATISQDYDIRATLAEVLSQLREKSVEKDETELGEKIYKILFGRRYLIIMDDIWSLEVWEKMKFFFPDYNNGSRVLVTTRISNLATHLTDPNSLLDLKSLDEISSWTLFSKTVFGEDSFPPQLENIGKKIVSNCNGHPLSIVVIGGLLAKFQHTQEYWEHIEKNLISIVNSENDEYCLRILKMSYNHLPVCLKPCFLYMGVFEEDRSLKVSTLVNLWVCEGFVKQRNDKSLETIGEEYLKELVDRNLILVDKLGLNGNIKYCKIHDLLRDVCLKEGKKQRFYYAIRDEDSARCMDSQRRITIRNGTRGSDAINGVLRSSLHVRSFLSDEHELELFPEFRLLRILSTMDKWPMSGEHKPEDVFQYVNSRYLDVSIIEFNFKLSSSINLLWNLHTLILSFSGYLIAPDEIWKMHQLRHLECIGRSFHLRDPPSGDNDMVVMENLETLKGVENFILNEEVVKRIPNIKKLCVDYYGIGTGSVNFLSYLECLSKLETFICWSERRGDELLQHISFPKSLKKLKLYFFKTKRYKNRPSKFMLESILPKIGSLPHLQKLTLEGGVFATHKWETMEGQFPSLKVLELYKCGYLENWIVSESSHFPLLQELRLSFLTELKDIPSEIGEIATLKSIELRNCSKSMVLSAKKIVEEQEDLHGEQPDLHVRVVFPEYREARELEYLASPNFHLDFFS